jgi:hypothetical protein
LPLNLIGPAFQIIALVARTVKLVHIVSKRGTSRRLIVAAIGGGNEPGAVPNARTFGRLIALAGPILLTGGIPVEDEGRVSYAALSGCQALGGRMISVLPRQNANVCALVDPSRIEWECPGLC